MTDLRSGVGQLRPRFAGDGHDVFFLGLVGGSVRLFAVPIEDGEVREVIGGDRMLLNFSITDKGIVYGASTDTEPGDLFTCLLNGREELQITDVNRDVLPDIDVLESFRFEVQREDGSKIEGWYILPPGFIEGKKYATLLQIHGGPHSAYGSAYFHEFQVLASRGYIVVYTNPRGSQGYGQAFADAISEDWGGIDYEDLMACLDHVIELGIVDEAKLGVGGGSYGGYMSAWIIGQTDRFKAAVASRLVSNLYSAWGTGDFTWMLWNWEMRGTPQERSQLYIDRSPVQHAGNITTPLLLTHAEDDLRCNVEQAQQMYMALKVRKKPVKLVLFPSGGHDISRTGKPSYRVERLQQIADWYDAYLKGD
jgi:dipeptidyl aminopeptidase/acylaminoacyl peptidase